MQQIDISILIIPLIMAVLIYWRVGKLISILKPRKSNMKDMYIRRLREERFIMHKSMWYFFIYILRRELLVKKWEDYNKVYTEIHEDS